MGLCVSTEQQTPEQKLAAQREKKKSKGVEQALADDNETKLTKNRLLFLGSGESGKSTLLKQMTIIHGQGYNEQDRQSHKPTILANITESIVSLCLHSKQHETTKTVQGHFETPAHRYGTILKENQVHYDTLMTVEHTEDSNMRDLGIYVDSKLAVCIAALWKDPGIQETYRNRAHFQLPDSTKYFLDRVEQIAQDSYIPTTEDLLLARVATSGIVEQVFNIAGSTFIMLDVGGQRSERKKWIHCFDCVTAIIFVAALSDYDTTLFEDENLNRMRDAIGVFKSIAFEQFFDKTALIIFFNKKDIFAEKIQQKPVKTTFKQEWDWYLKLPQEGPEDLKDQEEDLYKREGKFVERLFLDHRLFLDDEQNPQQTPQQRAHVDEINACIAAKGIYTHHTCATDTNQIATVFGIVKDIVVKRGLQRAGLM